MSESLSTTTIYRRPTSLTTITTHNESTTVTYISTEVLDEHWTPFTTSTLTFTPISSNLTDTGTTTSTNSTNSTPGPPTNLTTSPTPTAVTKSKLSKGVPTGIVVGVGVGTALVGAFLALLGVWLFLRQSRRSRPAGGNSSPSLGDHVGRFGGAKNSIGKGLSTSIVALDDLPFDPVDDSQTRKSMQDLYELIHQHAENHYNAWNFEGRREDLRHELAKGGWNDRTEQSAQTLASLLVNPTTRRVAIRHIIAWAIIQHIDLKSNPDTSLLPAHIVASGQALLKIKRTPGEQESKKRPLHIPFYKSLQYCRFSILKFISKMAPPHCRSLVSAFLSHRQLRMGFNSTPWRHT